MQNNSADPLHAELDTHAAACPASQEATVPQLATWLVSCARSAEERVRLLHRWVCTHIRYDLAGLRDGSYQHSDLSAEGVLRRREGVCSGCDSLPAVVESRSKVP